MYDVFNYHFLSRCNYNCTYCFKPEGNELPLDKKYIIIDKISEYFKRNKIKGRINFVGGEPLLSKDLLPMLKYCKKLGIQTSIETNGYYLMDYLDSIASYIDTIGISVDSINDATNIKIGRAMSKRTLSKKTIELIFNRIKALGIKSKLVLVASQFNMHEDFTNLLKNLRIDRLKILQMTIVCEVNDAANFAELTQLEFESFYQRYKEFNPIVETTEQIKESYLFINPRGELLTNSENKHKSVGSILECNTIDSLIMKCNLNFNTFSSRYTSWCYH